MTRTVKKPIHKPKPKKKDPKETSTVQEKPKTPLDFSDWSDVDYANHFQLENLIQNAANGILQFKPDDPVKFLASYFKLSKIKEYPYRKRAKTRYSIRF